MSDAPVVKLYYNPWPSTLGDGVVLQILQTAAVNAAERLATMIANGEVEEGRDSFAAVLLDPTRTKVPLRFADRLFASIEIGPNAARYLPNGAAKAHAHDRHGVPNGELVESYSHCLADSDFAYGNSAEYELAIGGGSGLSVEQDGEMVEAILEEVMEKVRWRRDTGLAELRSLKGDAGHRWYNTGDKPGEQYAAIIEMDAVTPALA